MKRQCTGSWVSDGGTLAREIQWNTSALDDISSPWMPPITSTRKPGIVRLDIPAIDGAPLHRTRLHVAQTRGFAQNRPHIREF